MKKRLFIFCILLAAHGRVAAVYSQKSLKLLMVTDKFPWSSRPFINNQIAGLINKGHDVHILSTSNEGDACMPDCLAGYDLSKRLYYKQLPKKEHVFDAILIQFPQSRGAQPLYKMHKAGDIQGKLVLFFRGEDLSAMIKKDAHRYDSLLQQADLCLPVCDYFKQRLIRLGCKKEKIHVIHSAIDCTKFPYSELLINTQDTISIVSACRLVPKKGIKFAVLAVIGLHKMHPNIQYTIIGDGPERTMLKDIISLMGAQDYIHLVGQLPHDQVQEKLSKADVFILPSVTALHGDQEGIPNALMEAMASGLPVVSTFHAGIPELIEHTQRGFLAAERDVMSLVEALTYILEHPSQMLQITKNARLYVEEAHNTDIENNKLEELLLNVCSKK